MVEIKKKTDCVSWDDIRKLIFFAHESNRKNGVDIRNAHLSAGELKTCVGEDGICLVALDGTKLVGTCSVAFENLDCWYAKGMCAYFTLDAVSPDYKGKGIFSQLEKKRLETVLQLCVNTAFMYVAEKNVVRRRIAKKHGFTPVEIRYNPFNSHNFIVYCKYFNDKRLTFRLYARCRFIAQWLKLKTKQWVKKIL